MKRSFEERLKRIEALLRGPDERPRLLFRILYRNGGEFGTVVREETLGPDGKPILVAPEDQEKFRRLTLEVIKPPLIPALVRDQGQIGPDSSQDSVQSAPAGRTQAPPCDGKGSSGDLATMTEADLRAEINRLRQRRIMLLMEAGNE